MRNNKHILIAPIEGLSGYRLSKLISEIDFRRPNARGQMRGGSTKAVMRVLADRYPNAWASIPTDAKKANISERQFQRELRRLEYHYRLIVQIADGVGGHHKNTPQYFILDRKILNIIESQQWFRAGGTGDISASEGVTSQIESQPKRVTGETTGDISAQTDDISDIETGLTGDSQSPKENSQVTKEHKKKVRRENRAEKPHSHSPLCDLTSEETVGERFSLTEDMPVEEIIKLISDGTYDVSLVYRYKHQDALVKACRDAVQEMNDVVFSGRKTCGDIMGRVMTVLDERFGVKVPKPWYPVVKELREQGGPAIYSKSKAQRLEADAPGILRDPQSALHFYETDLKPFEQILIEAARHIAIPGSWPESVSFLNKVVADQPHTELEAVRDRIQTEHPEALSAK